MKAIVSVIIPVYNCKKYIEKCLHSVINQTYSDIEIIVIDDGSNDGTGILVDRLVQDIQYAKVFHQENQGVSAARNYGLKKASGKYILFVDGDDYLGDNYVEKLVSAAEKNDSELVICGYKMVDTEKNVLKEIVPGEYVALKKEEWAYRIAAACSRMYRKDVWDRYQVSFETGVRGEDVPIALFFNKVCKNIKTIQMAEYYYVQHEGSAMHNFRGLRNFKLPYSSIEKILRYLKKIEGKNSDGFFELGMMRFFTQCIFDLGRGAEKEQLHELCDFVERIMKEYFPGYWKNKESAIWSELEIPFINKVEVKVFMVLLKLHMLYPAARIL